MLLRALGGARCACVLLFAMTFIAPLETRAQDAPGARAEPGTQTERQVSLTGVGAAGARAIEELASVRSDAETRLARCRTDAARVGGTAAARVRLAIAASGRVTAATVLTEGDLTPEARRWHQCATRALSQLRLRPGGAGTIELTVQWSPAHTADLGIRAGAHFGRGGLAARGGGGGGTGTGTIGLGSVGEAGRGTASAGFEERPDAISSRVRTGAPEVSGPLSPERIRRIVGQHIAEVRFCHERALVTSPQLAGRVEVRFTIAADGSVHETAVTAETLGSRDLVACVVSAVGRWRFPPPEGGGVVHVLYPFVLDLAPR